MEISIKESNVADAISSIFLVENTQGEIEGFQALIKLMKSHDVHFYKTSTHPNGIVPSDGVVLLKVNSQWDQRGGTNTDLVKTIVDVTISHPEGFTGEVIIVDNGQAQYGSTRQGGSLDYKNNNASDTSLSNQKVADSYTKHKVSTYLWDNITTNQVLEYEKGDAEDGYIIYDETEPTGIRVSYPKFKSKHGSYISFKKGVWSPELKKYDQNKLVLLNIPVLKAHFIYGVTGCVKHYMGVVSDKLQNGNAHRSVRNGGMGSMIAKTRQPDLNILDAIYVNSTCGKGPSCSFNDATQLNIVMASTDPVALDYWATNNVLMKAAREQGQTDLSKFDPYNVEAGSHGDWMRKSLKIMQEEGLPFTNEISKVNLYKTLA